MAKPRMVAGREQEADAGFVQRLSRHLRRHVELRAQLLQYIGRSAARRDRAVAVLRHRQSRRRRDEGDRGRDVDRTGRSEEHTSELQSLMRISYAVFCLKKKKKYTQN